MKKRLQGMNWIRKEKRLAIYLRDGLACVYCGSSVEDGIQLSLDHCKPYSKGGNNSEKNLVTCCAKCNSSRGNRSQAGFICAVAGYVEKDEKEIARHVRNCRNRKIDTNEAKKIIARRGCWAKVVEKNFS
jgi:5-methylcytosine-specific restriction endonuclease McrA